MSHKEPLLTFTVEGNPIPKARHRAGKSGYAYTPAKTRRWENTVAKSASLAMLQAGQDVIQEPVGLVLNFHRDTRHRCDLDNLVKSIKDGMNDVVYEDDSQVLACMESMERGVGRGNGSVTVRVYRLQDWREMLGPFLV